MRLLLTLIRDMNYIYVASLQAAKIAFVGCMRPVDRSLATPGLIKPRLCRLLFTQYKTTWFVRIRL